MWTGNSNVTVILFNIAAICFDIRNMWKLIVVRNLGGRRV